MFDEHQKEFIRRSYREGKPITEIADDLGCNRNTVGRRVRKWGLERVWDDEELLRILYHEKKLTSREIADRLGTGKTEILRKMKKYDIERRENPVKEKLPRYRMHTDGRGYMVIRHHQHWVYLHRLLAVAEYGVEDVRDMDVHHKNRIPWDNREDNIELLSRSDHAKEHRSKEVSA